MQQGPCEILDTFRRHLAQMSRRRSHFFIAASFSAFFLCSLRVASGQQSIDENRIGVPYDWSHRHLIFANSDSPEVTREAQKDPRYWQQFLLRNLPAPPHRLGISPPPIKKRRYRRDWSESMGNNAYNQTSPVYPAKYVFNAINPTPSCTNDYVVYLLAAPSGAFNVIAFNNLYVNNASTGFCSGTAPTVLFDYNASQNGGSLLTSPVLSEDGAQIAFIEDASKAQFHVLKWKSGNVGSSFPAPYNTSNMANCATNGAVAPCEYSLVYSQHSATLSAPFVDYQNDVAYVSDDNAQVWAIHPVFKGGAPAVATGYPLTPGSGGDKMTPPVYDQVSKNVFVADQHGNLYYIRTSSASSGTCVSSSSPPCVGSTTLNVASGQQVLEAPIVDSTNQTVFVFSNGSPDNAHSSVVQTDTHLSFSGQANVGAKGGQNVYSGSFNNAYFNNPGSGMLYVCGQNTGGTPALYGITFTGTTMNTGTAAHGPLNLATGGEACSPVTENYNQSNSTDYIFLGVVNSCNLGGLPGNAGCVYEFPITSGFPASTAAVGLTEANGTTGIIVDNVSDGSGGQSSNTNLYFVTQSKQTCNEYTGTSNSSGNCAVKLTQSGFN